MQLFKIDDFKPVAAFIENTVRPILDELKECGLYVDIKQLNETLSRLMVTHVLATIINAGRDIAVIYLIVHFLCKTSV